MESPVSHAFAVVLNDGNDLSHVPRAIHVGGSGNLRLTMADGSTVTFAGMAAGWHPVRVRRVLATKTTATSIVGYF
ncbi:hypothetical protein [Loktanella salsilacus]|jgi:hypothetical protein|uniref:spike base protein, RCAP_Rcc01079 family n=1 Tax=Loktanella salsilacus TaxID=195913 RepID=UPI003704B6E5